MYIEKSYEICISSAWIQFRKELGAEAINSEFKVVPNMIKSPCESKLLHEYDIPSAYTEKS